MSVPDFQTLMLPVLRELADGREKGHAAVRGPIAVTLELTPEDLSVMLPSGRQSQFNNRIAWALGYLKQAGLLETPRRGSYRITDRGRNVLGEAPSKIDIGYLERFPEFVAFRSRGLNSLAKSVSPELLEVMTKGLPPTVDGFQLTPDEQVRLGDERLRENLSVQLLERISQTSAQFFEQLVVDLLVAMGYGGTHEDAASVVGRSGDGGIDGIIKEDRLGLESIYVQAKRWKIGTTVGRPDIQQFAGALQGHKARKGVFITTAHFSREAIEYAKNIQTTVVLIDGQQLAQFMIEFGVGVNQMGVIKLMRLDEDYFSDED